MAAPDLLTTADVARSYADLPGYHAWYPWEAALATRLSEDTLDRSDCPRVKIGRSVRYDPVETMKWLRTHLTHRIEDAK